MQWINWNQKKQNTIGLEINRHAIKLLHLTKEDNQINIEQIIQIDQSMPVEQDKVTLSNALQRSLEQLQTHHRQIAISIEDSQCFSYTLTLEDSNIPWETAALLKSASVLPIPLDNLYYDFQRTQSFDETKQVFGIFCRKETIQKYLNIFKCTAYQLDRIELSSHAIARSYRYLHDLDQYKDYWICIEISNNQAIMILWHYQKVLAQRQLLLVPSDYDITHRIYQELTQLLVIHAKNNLKGLWIIGEYPLRSFVEEQLRHAFDLSVYLPAYYDSSKINNLAENANSYYVPFGLALGGL